MTEPVPSDYDRLVQDPRLDGLEELVHPYYQPPGEQEYSFPVAGQGVSSEMFQQISRAAGTGVFVQHDAEGAQSPYRLTGMPGGDSETNAQNTMMLRTSSVTGRSEAAIEGFFHTQLQDMPVSFPPVTTSTTYYLALTYDPRREEEEAGPIRIEVHTNDLPTTHGRKHIVLYTVHREPNQLLTQATTQQHKPWLGHIINVWSYENLPAPTQVEYGTLAVVINSPGLGQSGQPAIYTSRGVWGWDAVVEPPGNWLTMPVFTQWGWSVTASGARQPRARWVAGGLQLNGRLFASGASDERACQLPSGIRATSTFRTPVSIGSDRVGQIGITTSVNGRDLVVTPYGQASFVQLDGVIIPDTILETY